MAATVDKVTESDVATLRQLKSQLQELEYLAASHGLWLAATLIGAAFESISEEMDLRVNGGGRASRLQEDHCLHDAPAGRPPGLN